MRIKTAVVLSLTLGILFSSVQPALAQDTNDESIQGKAFQLIQPAAKEKPVSAEDDKNRGYLKSVMDSIKSKYNGEVTDKELIEGALKGMLKGLDPYTVFYTKDEARRFLNGIDGSYSGLGVELSKAGDYVTVTKVFAGTPAEEAGIVAGDKIIDLNGKNVEKATTEQVSEMIRESGEKILLGLIKSGDTGVTAVEVFKKYININPVTFDFKNGIGYIKLDLFNQNTMDFMTQALNEMDSKQIDRIILDLRNNPGGDLAQVIQVARKFVPKGLITKLDFKSEQEIDQEYYSKLKSPKYKIAVLVNKNSASASEVLAGALQDSGAGTLIGTKTFGKAKVQGFFPVLTPQAHEKYARELGDKIINANELMQRYFISPAPDEILGYIKMTTGMYTTPKGRMIDGVGLQPDIQINDPAPVKGIDIDSIKKLKKKSKPGLNSMGPDVYNAEMILKITGYDINTPNGKLDEKTFSSIAKFQKDNGLFPYGVLDYATQDVLNRKLDEQLMKLDLQYAEAVKVLSSE